MPSSNTDTPDKTIKSTLINTFHSTSNSNFIAINAAMWENVDYNQVPSVTGTFRFMGQTIATPFLRRTVSHTPARLIEFVDETTPNDTKPPIPAEHYAIENIIGERVHRGKRQYRVVWAGEWPPKDKCQWISESWCLPADITEWNVDKRIEQTKRDDQINGVSEYDEVVNARGPKARKPKRDRIVLRQVKPLSSAALARKERYKNRVSRQALLVASEAGDEPSSNDADQMDTDNGRVPQSENSSDEDAEFEEISAEEQALYASRSDFGM